MSALRYQKGRITRISNLLKTLQDDISAQDIPFTFPTDKVDLVTFIKDQRSRLKEELISLTEMNSELSTIIDKAETIVNDEMDKDERDVLSTELFDHMNGPIGDIQDKTPFIASRIKIRLLELDTQEHLIPGDQGQQGQQGQHVARVPADNSIDAQPAAGNARKAMRLPRVTVPSFEGDFRNYASFRSSFKHLVEENTTLSDMDKFLFLKESLKGQASRLIAPLEVTPENYQKALEILEARFDKGSSMVEIIMGEIRRMKIAEKGHKACAATLDELQLKISLLESHGVDLEKSSEVWRGLILSKFPMYMRKELIKKEKTSGNVFKISELLQEIEDAILIDEEIDLTNDAYDFHGEHSAQKQKHCWKQNTNDSDNENESGKHVMSGKHARSPENQRAQCVCGKNHQPSKCYTFDSVEKRRQEVSKHNGCWKCFETGHTSKSCTRYGPCPTCGQAHHSALCFQREKQGTDSSHKSSQASERSSINWSPNAEEFVPSATSQQHTNSYSMIVNAQSTIQRIEDPQIVLMTADVYIFNQDVAEFELTTIFFDGGAMRSLIKADLSKKLGLHLVESTETTMSGIGEITTTFDTDIVKMILKSTVDPRCKLTEAKISTREKLTSAFQTAELSQEDKSFIKKARIPIAQLSLESVQVKPDIVIGQDLMSAVMRPELPSFRLPSGLQLTPTLFGYAIQGVAPRVNRILADTSLEHGTKPRILTEFNGSMIDITPSNGYTSNYVDAHAPKMKQTDALTSNTSSLSTLQLNHGAIRDSPPPIFERSKFTQPQNLKQLKKGFRKGKIASKASKDMRSTPIMLTASPTPPQKSTSIPANSCTHSGYQEIRNKRRLSAPPVNVKIDWKSNYKDSIDEWLRLPAEPPYDLRANKKHRTTTRPP